MPLDMKTKRWYLARARRSKQAVLQKISQAKREGRYLAEQDFWAKELQLANEDIQALEQALAEPN